MTFQTIMNDLLRNMIERGDVAVFIDDVMVEMKIEKRIIEEDSKK